MDTMSVKLLSALPIFPFADEFPYLSDEEMLELAQDIEENGLHHPIVLFTQTNAETGEMDDVVLDGRNRLRALAKTKLTEAPVEYYEGADPIGYVIALNMLRRHLTSGQRAMLAVAAVPFYEAQAKERQRLNIAINTGKIEAPVEGRFKRGEGDTDTLLAEKFGIGHNSVSQAKSLTKNAPDLAEAVKAGTTSLTTAYAELKKRQDSAGGSYDGAKAHESEPEKRAQAFQERLTRAFNNFMDAIEDYASDGTAADIHDVTLRCNKIIATAEKLFKS